MFTVGRVKRTAAGIIVLLGVLWALPSPAAEGYDPMLQITHQLARPDIYMVQDTSGSMAWDINGHSVGVDSVGETPSGEWIVSKSGCSDSDCRHWYYKLRVYQTLPSRMAKLKNALGNSVTIITAWEPPGEWTTDTSYGYITNTNWKHGTISGPSVSTHSTYRDYEWEIDFGRRHHEPDPGSPFTAYDGSDTMTVGTGGVSLPPADLVGQTSGVVNWGLITFGGSCSSYSYHLQVPIDSNDTGDVSAIEAKLRLHRDGGLNANGSTPTRGALQFAATELTQTFNADPKYMCNRAYGAILVTDGESNACNPYSSTWSNCSTEAQTNYTQYPAGKSEEIWNLNLTRGGSAPRNVRTWVIGVSNEVGPCELNYTAYMGRTDASSPNGDAGFDTVNDPYLPTSTGDTSHYTINSTHPGYAYFATASGALEDAFAAIVAAVAVGDYTTSAPVATSTTNVANLALLPSAQYPTWKGHLYAFDLTKPSTDPNYELWDAGEVLASTAASSRNIYTWDASNKLVAVTSKNLSTLQSIATAFTPSFSGSSLTSNVVDFIRGNDGNGTPRTWKLGAVINSTPAVVVAPEKYKRGKAQDHTGFESEYANRTPVVWVGSDDGMMHCFKLSDGSEVLALLPPNLLSQQVQLYDHYLAKPVDNPTGEPRITSQQVYGVASSPRYGDVYFGSPTKDYKTVLLLTEGPGGDLVAAVDVTDVVPTDTTYVAPSILWTRTGSSPSSLLTSGLHKTWSVPAFGYDSQTTAKGVMGAGFDPSSTAASQVAPDVFTLNPGTGVFTTSSLSNGTSPLVGNQAFAASVIFNKTDNAFYADSIVDLGLQADLNGRIWFLPAKTWAPTIGIDATAKAGQTQPIYYSPAATGFVQGSLHYDLYAFASGTFYEQSPTVTGPNVGTSGYFIPSFYIVAKPMDATKATNDEILQIPIKSVNVPGSTDTFLGPRSQVTAPPMVFVPVSGTGNPVALFLVYDPDTADCGGTSYIVKISFDIKDGKPATVSQTTYEAGEGAGSGFALAGGKVIVARSGIGAGQKASVSTVPDLNPTEGLSNPTPTWWRELK
jgi:hypothetical protein